MLITHFEVIALNNKMMQLKNIVVCFLTQYNLVPLLLLI